MTVAVRAAAINTGISRMLPLETQGEIAFFSILKKKDSVVRILSSKFSAEAALPLKTQGEQPANAKPTKNTKTLIPPGGAAAACLSQGSFPVASE